MNTVETHIINLLKECPSLGTWCEYADVIKDMYGDFPDWWVREVVLSGMLIEKLKEFSAQEEEEVGHAC